MRNKDMGNISSKGINMASWMLRVNIESQCTVYTTIYAKKDTQETYFISESMLRSLISRRFLCGKSTGVFQMSPAGNSLVSDVNEFLIVSDVNEFLIISAVLKYYVCFLFF